MYDSTNQHEDDLHSAGAVAVAADADDAASAAVSIASILQQESGGGGLAMDVPILDIDYWINELIVPKVVSSIMFAISDTGGTTDNRARNTTTKLKMTIIKSVVRAFVSILYYSHSTTMTINPILSFSGVVNGDDFNNKDDTNLLHCTYQIQTPAMKLLQLAAVMNVIDDRTRTRPRTTTPNRTKFHRRQSSTMIMKRRMIALNRRWVCYVLFKFIVPACYEILQALIVNHVHQTQFQLAQFENEIDPNNISTTTTSTTSYPNDKDNRVQQYIRQKGLLEKVETATVVTFGTDTYDENEEEQEKINNKRDSNNSKEQQQQQMKKKSLVRYQLLLNLMNYYIDGTLIPMLNVVSLIRLWSSSSSLLPIDPIMNILGFRYIRVGSSGNSNGHTSNRNNSSGFDDVRNTPTTMTPSKSKSGSTVSSLHPSSMLNVNPAYRRWQYRMILVRYLLSSSSSSNSSSSSYSTTASSSMSLSSPIQLLLLLEKNFIKHVFEPLLYRPFCNNCIRPFIRTMKWCTLYLRTATMVLLSSTSTSVSLSKYMTTKKLRTECARDDDVAITASNHTSIGSKTMESWFHNYRYIVQRFTSIGNNNSIGSIIYRRFQNVLPGWNINTTNNNNNDDHHNNNITKCPLCYNVPIIRCQVHPCQHIYCYVCLYRDATNASSAIYYRSNKSSSSSNSFGRNSSDSTTTASSARTWLWSTPPLTTTTTQAPASITQSTSSSSKLGSIGRKMSTSVLHNDAASTSSTATFSFLHSSNKYYYCEVCGQRIQSATVMV